VPVNFRITPPEIRVPVSDCRPTYWSPTVLANGPTACVASTRPFIRVIVAAAAPTTRHRVSDDLIAEPGNAPQSVDIPQRRACADHVHLLVPTGRPKGAVLHPHHLARPGDATCHDRRRHQPRRRFIGVPLLHIAGVANTITPLQLCLPTGIYPLGAIDPGALLATCARPTVTSMFPVPANGSGVRRAIVPVPGTAAAVLSLVAAPRRTRCCATCSRLPRHPDLRRFGQTEM